MIIRWMLSFLLGALICSGLSSCGQSPEAFHFGTDPGNAQEPPKPANLSE